MFAGFFSFNFELLYQFELNSLRCNEITMKLLITGCRDKAKVGNDVIFKQ